MILSTKQRQILTLEESNLADATKIEYGCRLRQFFRNSTITSYDELIKVPNEELENTLVDYCKFILHKVRQGKLSPNTVPKMFKPIKFVLGINYRENDVRWRPLESLFPPEERRSGFRAWTTEQIQEMIDRCSGANISRNKALVHFMASIGGRIGIHEHPLLMKHLIPMSSNDTQNMDCYAVLLYAESDESAEEKDYRDSFADVVSGDSYWAFLTPEATKWLKRYHGERQKYGEVFDDETPIFRNIFTSLHPNSTITQLSKQAVFNIFERIVRNTSIKRTQKGRRYDIQLLHGFRKRFNTILKLENSVNANIAEKIMGHKNGLDGVYFVPTRQQCFKEFVKGIPFLTISDDERMRLEIRKLRQENTEKKQFEAKIKIPEQRQVELENEQKKSIKITPELDKMLMKYFEELGEDFIKKVFSKKLTEIN